jgi:hypothetical protein
MNDMKLAKGLGWFSIGLGLTEMLAPQWLGRQIGVGDSEDKAGILRAMGAREAITGVGVLMQRKPTLGLWGRVAGDVVDMALLASAFKSPEARKGRLAGATGMVLGVGLLDLACAQRLQSS